MGPEAFDRSDLFTARLEAKNSSSSPANFFSSYYWNIDRKMTSAYRCCQELTTKIDREVEPKQSSFSRKKEVAKFFLCSELSIKSC